MSINIPIPVPYPPPAHLILDPINDTANCAVFGYSDNFTRRSNFFALDKYPLWLLQLYFRRSSTSLPLTDSYVCPEELQKIAVSLYKVCVKSIPAELTIRMMNFIQKTSSPRLPRFIT